MQDEKFKKIVIGATVAAVLLLAFLLIFLVYQLVSISVRKNREAELTAQLEACLAYIESAESDLEVYRGRVWLETIARELGMKGFDDIDWSTAAESEPHADSESLVLPFRNENGEVVLYEVRCH